MKNLFIILLVAIFILLSCTENSENSGGGSSGGNSGITSIFSKPELSDKVQIFPIQESYTQRLLKSISFGRKMYAIVPVEPTKALTDWDNGCMYAENSFEYELSVKYQEINYLDVGAEYGIDEKLFVNVCVDVIDYSENANPIVVYVRAKGSSGTWTVITPTLDVDDAKIVVTNENGELEWYANNSSYYDWIDPEHAEPGVHVYGHQTIIVYSDGATLAL